ncbi:6373_t:CDS:10 [Ambispora gerdemannii]|uniref:6373_t:CDS:1 n=1 Tax=Ambispora gerdemannii TaxID=144530 RepID=A0A9N8V056_9GLOM|nr:6373_t:CDS:10 [Ambispora gerdemannii]
MQIRETYIHYVNKLIDFLGHVEPGLQIPSLKILLDLLKSESAFLTFSAGSCQFSNNHFFRVVEGLLDNENFSEPLKNEFVEKYWNVYDDLRFYFLKDAAKIINLLLDSGTAKDQSGPSLKKRKMQEKPDSKKLNRLMENTFSILDNLRTMPTDESEIDGFWIGHPAPDDIKLPIILRLQEHKRVFSECWLSLLKLPMTLDSYKKILLIMHKKIIPHMLQPPLLMDFLTDSYNAGGVVSILALNGLFTLIHEHNLDYPDFYKKLYGLFDRNLMHVKYRSRFFRLVDLFLASTHLPIQLIAAFIKRMSRLSLTSPPHGIVILIPMIYNLMKRHPGCMQLIHRSNNNHEIVAENNDPYNFDEKDPMESGAIDSSLWEIKTLQDHYYPNVATLAKIFEEQFTKPSYNLEDFLDHTYTTIFETEIKRSIKKLNTNNSNNRPPALAFEKPKYLFPSYNHSVNNNDEINNDDIWKMWEF